MLDEKKAASKHRILLERRESAQVTGVTDVISFDEDCVMCETDFGMVVLKGSNLRVSSLNVDNGELNLDGEVDSVTYETSLRDGKSKSKGSVFGKIFK